MSTWLNAGVEATRVAERAGHSVAGLLRTYAKYLDGGEQAARDRVETALGAQKLGHALGKNTRRTPVDAGYSRTQKRMPP